MFHFKSISTNTKKLRKLTKGKSIFAPDAVLTNYLQVILKTKHRTQPDLPSCRIPQAYHLSASHTVPILQGCSLAKEMPLISIPTVHNRKTANKFLMQAKESPSLYVKQIFSFFLKTCCKCILISTTGLRAAGRKLTTSRQIRTGKRTAQHNSKEKIKESPTMECKQLRWTDACLHLLHFHLLISAKAKHG